MGRSQAQLKGSDAVGYEELSRREFLRRVLGVSGAAVASFVLVGCASGDDDDDDDDDDD
jgi:hypothetical protein